MALDAADIKAMFGLPPEDAIRFLEQKGYAITWNWWEQRDAAHAKALTVAKATRVDILQDFKEGLGKAMADGTTERDFVKRMTPILESKGWWGKQIIVDSEGGAEVAQLGSPHRLQTIFRTNTQSAYMAGRYQQMWAARHSHPWWQYVAILDSRTRASHRALNGKVFAADDPIWKTIFPPNGYNCRCRVRPLSDADLTDEGLAPMSSSRRMVTVEDDVGPDKRTGEVFKVRRIGIKVPTADGKEAIFAPDVGFAGNAGIDWTKPFTPPPIDSLPKTFPVGMSLPSLPAPARVPASRLLPSNLPAEDYARAFMTEFKADIGKPAVHVDVAGDALPVSESLFQDSLGKWKADKAGRGPYMRLLADAIRQPDEVWLRWEESRDRPGTWLLKRRYIKSFEVDSGAAVEPQYGLSVFEYGQDGWTGSTVMIAQADRSPAARLRYIEKQRDGFLLHRAKP